MITKGFGLRPHLPPTSRRSDRGWRYLVAPTRFSHGIAREMPQTEIGRIAGDERDGLAPSSRLLRLGAVGAAVTGLSLRQGPARHRCGEEVCVRKGRPAAPAASVGRDAGVRRRRRIIGIIGTDVRFKT